MYICYIDESGTSSIPGNTSHFVLAGLSIPIEKWKEYDCKIEAIKKSFGLENTEIHIGWIIRPYLEQTKIQNFDSMDYFQRRSQVTTDRKNELYRLQRCNPKLYKQVKINYKKTDPYIHLTYSERNSLIKTLATEVSTWKDTRLFAECVDKVYFDPSKSTQSIDEQCFEQIVSRFEQYLKLIKEQPKFGLLIHDNNNTVSKKHTDMMKRFHHKGTLWTSVTNIIETPLFVDSQLTSMVQIADLCAYALRKYLENSQEDLFNLIYRRADRKDGIVVGIRHFTRLNCNCLICQNHRR